MVSSFRPVSSYERKELDFYPTPKDALDAVLPHIHTNLIWEPACGDGRISQYFKDRGHMVYSSDLSNYGYAGQDEVRSFYAYDDIPEALKARHSLTILTNPPYGKDTEKFARHALDLAYDHFCETGTMTQVVLLYRHTWDSAAKRKYMTDRLDYKINMCWRMRWIEDTTTSPFHTYSWYIWINGGTGRRQNEYVYQS